MNILFAASEAVPVAKTGGLADVAGSLPKALGPLGADVRVIMPFYGEITSCQKEQFRLIGSFNIRLGWREQYCGLLEAVIDGIHYYVIDNEFYFKRGYLYGYEDEAERFVFFCVAVMESLSYLNFKPDIIHCHDWQTGLIPFLLRTRYRDDPAWEGVRSLFTIHNLKYQGVFSQDVLRDLLGIGPEFFTPEGLEFFGGGSCMKAALLYADKLTTVSNTYAQEIQGRAYGEKLDGVLRKRATDLSGIINGIDAISFDPMQDPEIAFPYRDSLAKKRLNKLALQRELGLPESEETPVLGLVSRLVEQKGLDLLEAIMEPLLSDRLQLVVLGTGETRYEDMLRAAMEKHPLNIAAHFGFDDGLARRIYAGSDMYLMPSQFEPCGLSQLIALQYRSVPIVRETGGLKDTVRPFNEVTGEGNGFCFSRYDAGDLLDTIRRAVTLYENQELWNQITGNAAKEDYSWNRSARSYMRLYRELASQRRERG
ncbi:glycogen synthase GlgA [Paenibacillus abyssi]|uniref:Glycogen synthase n=1 Tax=Paenibacillus abyssi TaxID=1340531 RepID=A0A917CHA2_9BACL|nr:glycogen synthase GlgA [Paenibacillus abyssi]GGF86845.1 glycogen synthase [Paenibacillus abyssi]